MGEPNDRAQRYEQPRCSSTAYSAIHRAALVTWSSSHSCICHSCTISEFTGVSFKFCLPTCRSFCSHPFRTRILIHQAKKRNRTLSLNGIVLYRESMPLKQYILLAATLLLYANFILAVVYPPIAQMLIKTLFFWLPDWFFLSLSLEYSKSVLLMTALLGLVINGFVAPVTEELYLRGYLLPRISRLKAWAPLINATLHSVYHLWVPWQVPGLILMGLPAAFAVWWKRNIYLGMIIHIVGNVLGSIFTLASILSLP